MRRRQWGKLVAAAAATVLLAGCGGDGGGDSGGGDDFTGQSAEEIADAAKEAMNGLEAVTVEGALTADGEEIDLRMEIGSDGDCQGEFTTQGATTEILGVDGSTWFRPDEAFWILQAGEQQGPLIAEAVGDRWVALPEGDDSFAQFCDIEEFLEELNDSEDATYEKGETTEIDGEEAIEIISTQEDEGESSGYVQVDGDHYLVRLEKSEGDEPGTVDFSGFDEQPDVEAPADDEQVTLEELQSQGY